MFLVDGSLIVILGGFIKKTRATPKHEIDTARSRQVEYVSNKSKAREP